MQQAQIVVMERWAGGIREGHELKFFTPGGSSTPILTADSLDLPLDYEGMPGPQLRAACRHSFHRPPIPPNHLIPQPTFHPPP